VTVRYDGVPAVRDITFDVYSRQITALIGPCATARLGGSMLLALCEEFFWAQRTTNPVAFGPKAFIPVAPPLFTGALHKLAAYKNASRCASGVGIAPSRASPARPLYPMLGKSH